MIDGPSPFFLWVALRILVCAKLVAGRGPKARKDTTAPEAHRVEDAGIPPLVCRALEPDAGTVGERFSAILPHHRGGSVTHVFQGDAKRITAYMGKVDASTQRLIMPFPRSSWFLPAMSQS